jgi:hypothetical protein
MYLTQGGKRNNERKRQKNKDFDRYYFNKALANVYMTRRDVYQYIFSFHMRSFEDKSTEFCAVFAPTLEKANFGNNSVYR